jgi:hypothetical protein
MAYCRFGDDSNVFMYGTLSSRIKCCMCMFGPKEPTEFDNPKEAMEHLMKHIDAGHRVPGEAVEKLKSEIKLRVA